MSIDKKDWEKIEKIFGRYAKVMDENFRSRLKAVVEKLEDHDRKFDLLFEMVAKNTEDIAIIKSDVSFIKHELKQKVDRDEFEALEKRVILLERKFTSS